MGAKQNLKQYLEVKRITPAQFYRDSNLSNGFLNQGDNISSNNIEIIISLYPDINLAWLITGNGEMLNSPNEKGRMLNEINVNSSIKNTHLNTHPNTHLSDKSNKNAYPNVYPSPQLSDVHPYPTIAVENAESAYSKKTPTSSPPPSVESMQLIKMLMDKINEKDAKLDEKDARLDEKDSKIEERDVRISHLSEELIEAKKDLVIVKAQLADYHTYNEELLRRLEAGAPKGKTPAKNVSIRKHSSPDVSSATSATAPSKDF